MISQALSFLVSFIFTAYVYLLLIRLLLQKIGASWHNPVVQFIVVATDKPVKPLRYIVPGIRGFDLAIVLLALIVKGIEVSVLLTLQPVSLSVVGLLVVTVGELLGDAVNLLFFITIISAILSWFQQAQFHPAGQLIIKLARPMCRWVGRWLPTIAGFDLSPIVVIIILKLFEILVARQIILFGLSL